MFCSNCGKEIDDKAVVCINCGCATQNNQVNKPQKTMLVTLLLWFFLGFFGAHRFYLGDSAGGSTMLILEIVGWLTVILIIGLIPLAIIFVWYWVDLFLILGGTLKPMDGSELG